MPHFNSGLFRCDDGCICEKIYYGDVEITPLEAVKICKEKLKEIKDDNDNHKN